MMRHLDRRMFPVACLSLFALAMLVFWVPDADSYPAYEASQGAGGSCSQCHPGFLDGFGAFLHDAHLPLADSNCGYCHVVPGDNPETGLDPTETRGCAGCHGRVEDAAGGEIAAGLRAHHTNAGAPSDSDGLTCQDCHTSDPSPPVGEDVFPPFFSALGLDPCMDNLDDDGDRLYDTEDPDCAQSECTVDADCDDGVICTLDTCDQVDGVCVNTPDDASCDNGDVCNGMETCDPVNDCQPGTPLICDDENLCTTDSCDAVAGCVFTPVECPPGEQCDPADGVCKGLPVCTVDAHCDDGMFCNGAETCDVATGTCLPGTPVDCNDGIDCTVDTCDEVNDECANTPDDEACPDDGLFCTGDEVCDPAAGCVSTGDPCPEGTACNECTDTCDAREAKKVTICHKGKNTISVGAPAVPAHLAHGDTLGPCEGDPWPDDDDNNGKPCDEDDNGKPGDDDDNGELNDEDDNGKPGDDNDNGELNDDKDADPLTIAGCGTSVSVPENPKAINLGCLVMVFGALVLWKRSGRRQ